MLSNIPYELRLLPQWVVSGTDKEPLTPRTGQRASVSDPTSWGSFDEASQAGYLHVGFVLTREDPYTIIDLDEPVDGEQIERHRRVLAAFDSYAELSQSGKGIHIILRGRVEAGRRRDKVEVYSDGRYMICTGNVLNARPITEHQAILDLMVASMPATVTSDLVEAGAIITDEALWDMAARAVNGDKFSRLWNGDMTGYASQSEADFALLSMLGFYSRSNDQVRRLFRLSALGRRDKAMRNDDYIDRALEKIRGRQVTIPLVDLSALIDQPMLPGLSNVETPAAPVNSYTFGEDQTLQVFQQPTPPPAPPAPSVILPPGLIGEMANYIYSSAYRPVMEMSLIGSLGLGAGICGRYFNISSTGLNQYLIMLAQTGTGKEGVAGGMDALIAALRPQIPAIENFIGPGVFASGQAFVRVLDKNPCFVSVLGEIGLTLQQICDKHAGAHLLQLRRALLDVYAKSGANKWLRPSVYSDSEKNTMAVRAPNITILGEATPTTFYGALDGHHIAEGLVPRFLVIEYTGPRPPANSHAFHSPDQGLVGRLAQMVQTSLAMANNDTCCPVQVDRWADAELTMFNVMADDQINGSQDDVNRQLWNRAHLKALKLAALVAVGCNIHQPIVTKDVANWAIDMVKADVTNMSAKFASGEVGHGDHEQESDIRKAVDRYPTMTEEMRAQYKVPKLLLNKGNLIPYVFLKRYLGQRASFRNDRKGAVLALKTSLDDMVKSGQLSQIPPIQAKGELGVDSPVYYRGEAW